MSRLIVHLRWPAAARRVAAACQGRGSRGSARV